MKADTPTANEPARLVVVSNRGALAYQATDQGTVCRRTVGGLVAAIEPVLEQWGGIWVSWQGRTPGEQGRSAGTAPLLPGHKYGTDEVRLSNAEYSDYYVGFANSCLWPLLHSFLEKCRIRPLEWQAYETVNQRFAARAVQVSSPGALVWVHDYHLTLVPELVRRQSPATPVALFWHVPFPPVEIFEVLPWAAQILSGMLGSDRVDFHHPTYAHNFLTCAQRLLGAQVELDTGMVEWKGRQVQVRALPLGIEYDTFAELAGRAEVQTRAAAIRSDLGAGVVLLGIDRLDYTKGIPERLEAFESFLERWPGQKGRVVLLQVGVPSRGDVPIYRDLRRHVEALVGRINGRFGDGRYQPVVYSSRSLSREEVAAHYLAADAALVTPLRDGLNLVAKEFVATRQDRRGVLVLSRFAGAAAELPEAVLVNPYDQDGLVEAIHRAVDMLPAEQGRRLAAMQAGLATHDLKWWWQQVCSNLQDLSQSPSLAPAAAGR